MSVQFTPLIGCHQDATERRTALAASVVHLFQSSFTPTPSNVLADYTAAEADYTGYAVADIATWYAPILAPGTGFELDAPSVSFQVGSTDPTVGNVIGGCYLVDSAGNLRQTVIFTQPIPMELAYQGMVIPLSLLFTPGV